MNGHNYTKVANWVKFRDDFFFDLNAEDSDEWIVIGFVNHGWQIENKNGKRFVIDERKWNANAATYELPEELRVIPSTEIHVDSFSHTKKPTEKLAVTKNEESIKTSPAIEVTPTDDISEEDLLNVIQEQENLPAVPIAKKKGRPAGSKK